MTSTMASGCNIDDKDTNPAKKTKFSANEDISPSKKMKFSANQDICKSQIGTNAGNYKRYAVAVPFMICNGLDSDEARKSFFSSLLEKAGCSESQISSYFTYRFFANLTDEQAKKLAGVENVRQVRPVERSMQGHDCNKSNMLQKGKDMVGVTECTNQSYDFINVPFDIVRGEILSSTTVAVIDSCRWMDEECKRSELNFLKPSCLVHYECCCSSCDECQNKGCKPESPPVGISAHGFFCAAIIASRRILGASIHEVYLGTLRGISPPPRIALFGIGCGSCLRMTEEDMAIAIRRAISRKVNVISCSTSRPHPADYYIDTVDFFTGDEEMLAAFREGILTVRPAGNLGCVSIHRVKTIAKSPPWSLTVASCTSRMKFRTDVVFRSMPPLVLETIQGFSIYTSGQFGWAKLSMSEEISGCTSLIYRTSETTAMIKPTNGYDYENCVPSNKAIVNFSKEQSSQISNYFHLARKNNAILRVLIKPSSRVAIDDTPLVSDFSSRGPCSYYNNFMKPDICAPGEEIAAAWPPDVRLMPTDPYCADYSVCSGTSFAVPHVAAIAAKLHAEKQFSPSAIMSAIITTAKKMHGKDKLAHEFAYGAGLVDAERAMRPGLVYEENSDNYSKFLDKALPHTELNLPYFSIAIPDGEEEWTCNFPRRVKSVEVGRHSYGLHVKIHHTSFDMQITDIQISPQPTRLIFEDVGCEENFVLTVKLPHTRAPRYSFGLISASLSLKPEDNEDIKVVSPIILSSAHIPEPHLLNPLCRPLSR